MKTANNADAPSARKWPKSNSKNSASPNSAATIAEHNRASDQAADEHPATTEPIQARMKVLEDEIMAAMADRQPTPTGAQEERAELLKQLEAANMTLARETKFRGELTAPLKARA